MNKTIATVGLIALLTMSGCAITPETINRYPDIGKISTAGVGEAIYTYDKKGEQFIDYMSGKTINQTNSVKQEIIYSGFSKGVLRVTYREYINDYARAAFYQDATYDYAPPSSTMITFKGAQVEVLDADNTQIKYRVIKGFSNE